VSSISNNILSQYCYWSCHLYLITFSVNTAFARLHGNYILSCRTFYYQNISMTLQVLQIRQKLLSTDQSGESAFWIGRVVPNDLPISDIKIGILSPWTIMQRGSEWVSEWVSGWLLFNANSAIFQLYHGENKLIFNEMMMRSALHQTNTPSWTFIVLAHRNNGPQIDMSLHSDTRFWLRANPSLLFGFTWPGLEPTIYRTRREHANNYATDAVIMQRIFSINFEVVNTNRVGKQNK
jgi:hypothetical protein